MIGFDQIPSSVADVDGWKCPKCCPLGEIRIGWQATENYFKRQKVFLQPLPKNG